MKRKMFLLFLSAVFLCHAADFVIVKGNRAEAELVYPAGQKIAAEINRFNSDVYKTAGVYLPKAGEGQKCANQILFEIAPAKNLMTEDTFSILFPQKNVMLIRCTEISLPWALNHLSETGLGVHFLFNAKCGKSYSPRKDIVIPRKDITVSPSFPAQRYTYLSTPVTRPWFRMKPGVSCGHDQHIHAFPSAKYFKNNSYPMAIRPVRNKKKLEKIPTPALYWQPCYSNPETARIAVENILEYLKKNPKTKSISLTVNDNGGFCECQECFAANKNKKYFYSEVYFTWVNRVAEEVCKKYPDLQIVALAYSQVYYPCSFKLHKNVMIVLCIDLYSATDPAVMKKHKNIIQDWSRKASSMGVWDYSWGYSYISPRVYFHLHAEMLRYLHQHGCRYYFGENEGYDAKEGPKMYLLHKLLWDIDSDVDALLDQWYAAAVGKQAAPFLKQYFDFWEEYFKGPEVRRTPWFSSASNTYMTWGDISHCYGLKNGDLAKLRGLMEKCVRLAGTPEEKERAKHLMRHFEYAECLLKLYGAEPIPPEGKLQSASDAVALLRSIPKAVPYIRKKQEIGKAMEQEPWLSVYYKNKYQRKLYRLDDNGTAALVSLVMMAADHAQNPEVRAELKKIGESSTLPPEVSSIAGMLIQQDGRQNLFTNGDMEKEPLEPQVSVHPEHASRMGKRSSESAFSGKYSCKFVPGYYTLVHLTEKALPNTFYLLSMKVMVPDPDSETYLKLALYPARNGVHQDYRQLPKINPAAGRWMTLTAYCRTKPNSNGVRAIFFLHNFKPGTPIYIDDVRLYQVGK